MSVQTVRRATAPVLTPPRRLRLLPTPRPERKTPRRGLFIAVFVSVLATGLVALLLLNTTLAQQSFTMHTLDRSSTALTDRESQLTNQVDQLTQPQSIAAQATALGMVPGCDPGFVHANGNILNTQTFVKGTRLGSMLIVAPPAGLTPQAAAAACADTPAQIAQAAAAAAAAKKVADDAAAAAAAPGAAQPQTTTTTVANPGTGATP